MNGQDHLDRAEQLVAYLEQRERGMDGNHEIIAHAAVHALLALARYAEYLQAIAERLG